MSSLPVQSCVCSLLTRCSCHSLPAAPWIHLECLSELLLPEPHGEQPLPSCNSKKRFYTAPDLPSFASWWWNLTNILKVILISVVIVSPNKTGCSDKLAKLSWNWFIEHCSNWFSVPRKNTVFLKVSCKSTLRATALYVANCLFFNLTIWKLLWYMWNYICFCQSFISERLAVSVPFLCQPRSGVQVACGAQHEKVAGIIQDLCTDWAMWRCRQKVSCDLGLDSSRS